MDLPFMIFRCTWDIGFFFLLITVHWQANRQDRGLNVKVPDSNGQLVATARTGGIVGVSILASAAMLTLSTDHPALLCHPICNPTMRSMVWFVVSIVAAMFVLSLLSMSAPATDARRRTPVIVPYFAHFLALLIGAIWLMAAVWLALLPTGSTED